MPRTKDTTRERTIKIAVLETIDYVVARLEIAPERIEYVMDVAKRHGIGDEGEPFHEASPEELADLGTSDPVLEFRELLGLKCPASLRDEDIRRAIDDWQNARGPNAKMLQGELVGEKFATAAKLLEAFGVHTTKGALKTFWSRRGTPAWRTDPWFASWNVRRRASDRN